MVKVQKFANKNFYKYFEKNYSYNSKKHIFVAKFNLTEPVIFQKNCYNHSV